MKFIIVSGLSFDIKNTFYTLERYSPVLVSILITSFISTKRGTLTTAPVSTVAGLVAPVAVSPLNPGSVSAVSYTHLTLPTTPYV